MDEIPGWQKMISRAHAGKELAMKERKVNFNGTHDEATRHSKTSTSFIHSL